MGESSFGKYRLIAELGHGGMADVFLAVQAGPLGSGFRKLTVIKRLRQNLSEEPEFVAMLVDEARIAARLNHPNVVQTNEVGEVNGQYFISMEYLDGQPFHRIQHRSSQRVKEGLEAPFDRDQQLIVLMDTLSGLHHAHELADFDGTSLQIVHRDVTPHNIFVTYDGQVKVVDFGIAKAAGRSSETRAGIVKGKVRYMAPEQAIGQAVDRRADIFSVGVMLWECVTGRRLWDKMPDLQVVQALVSGNFPRAPREVIPEIDPRLDAICAKALAQRADDRYTTADELKGDVEEYLAATGTLLSARRKMPAALNQLFHDKRTEIKAVIEKQLAVLEFKSTGDFMPVALSLSSSQISQTSTGGHAISNPSSPDSRPRSHSAPKLPEPPAVATERSTLPVPRPASVQHVPSLRQREVDHSVGRSGPRHLLPIALGIAAAAALAATVGAGLQPASSAAPTTVAEPELDEVSLRIATSPKTSRITVDDGTPQPAPLDIKVVRDGRQHRVRIEADGYIPKTELVTFARDVAVSVHLVRAVATDAASAAPTPEKPKTNKPPTPADSTAPVAPSPAPPASTERKGDK